MKSFPPQNKLILYGVLNWGLGHASRSIPLIQKLLDSNNVVILASDGESLTILQKEFPELESIKLPAYNVRYTKRLWSIVLTNFPNIIKAICQENILLRHLIKNYRPDIVISDSRFGFYSNKLPCYIISHQLKIKSKVSWIGLLLNLVNKFFLDRFNEVWVPDYPNSKLSGDLSVNKNISTARFIGPQSRMNPLPMPMRYDLGVILSGPEPSRSILEKKLVTVLHSTEHRVCFVRGTELGQNIDFPKAWSIFGLVGTKELNDILNGSKLIISRSGYSSVMDYYKTKVKAILIPTPGQSEQEYLGNFLEGKYAFSCIKEENLSMLSSRI